MPTTYSRCLSGLFNNNRTTQMIHNAWVSSWTAVAGWGGSLAWRSSRESPKQVRLYCCTLIRPISGAAGWFSLRAYRRRRQCPHSPAKAGKPARHIVDKAGGQVTRFSVSSVENDEPRVGVQLSTAVVVPRRQRRIGLLFRRRPFAAERPRYGRSYGSMKGRGLAARRAKQRQRSSR